jgi:hypothetical protein
VCVGGGIQEEQDSFGVYFTIHTHTHADTHTDTCPHTRTAGVDGGVANGRALFLGQFLPVDVVITFTF